MFSRQYFKVKTILLTQNKFKRILCEKKHINYKKINNNNMDYFVLFYGKKPLIGKLENTNNKLEYYFRNTFSKHKKIIELLKEYLTTFWQEKIAG